MDWYLRQAFEVGPAGHGSKRQPAKSESKCHLQWRLQEARASQAPHHTSTLLTKSTHGSARTCMAEATSKVYVTVATVQSGQHACG